MSFIINYLGLWLA